MNEIPRYQLTVREMLRHGIESLGGRADYAALRRFIRDHYGEVNPSTINAHLTLCSVNADSRIHYPQNKKARLATDPRFDFLFQVDRGLVEKYDPSRHGRWEIKKTSEGRFIVGRTEDVQTFDTQWAYPQVIEREVRSGNPGQSRTMLRSAVEDRLRDLTDDFEECLRIFDAQVPFTRTGQWELHRETINRRREVGTVANAIRDARFRSLLRQTLMKWGIGIRASRQVSEEAFEEGLLTFASELEALDGFALEELADQADAITEKVWVLIRDLPVVESKAKVVAGTKCLHHILPDLIPPMDREWTGTFFMWSPADLQNNQENIFKDAFLSLAKLAAQIKPSRFVSDGWRTSSTKCIDNALIGYMMRSHQKVEQAQQFAAPALGVGIVVRRKDPFASHSKEIGAWRRNVVDAGRICRLRGTPRGCGGARTRRRDWAGRANHSVPRLH